MPAEWDTRTLAIRQATRNRRQAKHVKAPNPKPLIMTDLSFIDANLQALLSLTSTVFADAFSPTHYAMNLKVDYLLLNGSS